MVKIPNVKLISFYEHLLTKTNRFGSQLKDNANTEATKNIIIIKIYIIITSHVKI